MNIKELIEKYETKLRELPSSYGRDMMQCYVNIGLYRSFNAVVKDLKEIERTQNSQKYYVLFKRANGKYGISESSKEEWDMGTFIKFLIPGEE